MGKTLVIGASENPDRYGYKAAVSLLQHGEEVVLFANKPGSIQGIPFLTEFPDKIENLETVTLYINPRIQQDYYSKIINLHPQRIIFNPGTENPAFEKLCIDAGIAVQQACTLVLLSTGQY